jgi:hypothetical protein
LKFSTAHSFIGKEDNIMFTIRQASEITGLPYARLWYGGVIGRYPRPELKVGNRLYYTQDQIRKIAEAVQSEQMNFKNEREAKK